MGTDVYVRAFQRVCFLRDLSSPFQHEQEQEAMASSLSRELAASFCTPQGPHQAASPAAEGCAWSAPLQLVHHGQQVIPLAGTPPWLVHDLKLAHDPSQLLVPLLVLSSLYVDNFMG